MAQVSRPSPDNGYVVTTDEYEGLAAEYAPDGVYGSPADTAVVYADATGRQVKVRAAKFAVVRGRLWKSDAATDETVGSLPANTSGNPRIDRLVLRLDRVTGNVRTLFVQGTPAGSPSPPALTQNATLTSGVWDFPLARWNVANGYTSIAAGDLTYEAWYPTSRGVLLCTSTSRPFGASISAGARIYEIDTKRHLWWDGTVWRIRAGQVLFAKFQNDNGYLVQAQTGFQTAYTSPSIAIEPNQTYWIHSRVPMISVPTGGFDIDTIIATAENGGAFSDKFKSGLGKMSLANNYYILAQRALYKAGASATSLQVRITSWASGLYDVRCDPLYSFAVSVEATGKLNSEIV